MKQNLLISKRYERACVNSIYIRNLLILAFVVSICVSIYAFDSVAAIPLWIINFAVRIKIWKNIMKWKKEKDAKF